MNSFRLTKYCQSVHTFSRNFAWFTNTVVPHLSVSDTGHFWSYIPYICVQTFAGRIFADAPYLSKNCRDFNFEVCLNFANGFLCAKISTHWVAQTSLYTLVCYSGALRISADGLRKSSFHLSSCVRGYVYKDVWAASAGAVPQCDRETRNSNDPYAVAVQKDGLTGGHVPRTISCICSIFVRQGGSIVCMITGKRQHSCDLPQGGLELPCTYTFSGPRALGRLSVPPLLPEYLDAVWSWQSLVNILY